MQSSSGTLNVGEPTFLATLDLTPFEGERFATRSAIPLSDQKKALCLYRFEQLARCEFAFRVVLDPIQTGFAQFLGTWQSA